MISVIKVTFHHATDNKGARFVVQRMDDDKKVTIAYDYEARSAARAAAFEVAKQDPLSKVLRTTPVSADDLQWAGMEKNHTVQYFAYDNGVKP